MLLILFGRVMPVNDGFVLYIVPKVIKSTKTLRVNIKREQDSLANSVTMLRPLLVGDYSATRADIKRIIKTDTILKVKLNPCLFNHWTENNVSYSSEELDSIMGQYMLRLKFILSRYELKPPLGWDALLDSNLIKDRGFVKYRKLKVIVE